MQHGRQVACRMHSIRENKKNGSEEKFFLLRRFLFLFCLQKCLLRFVSCENDESVKEKSLRKRESRG